MKYFPIVEPSLEPQFKMLAQLLTHDPGDTAQREGMFAIALHILKKLDKIDADEFNFCVDRYIKNIGLLNDPNHPGLIRRYPDPAYWGGQSDRLSRDQSVSNVIAMGFLDRGLLKNFFLAHLKYRALLFLTNTRANWAWPPGDPRYSAAAYKWKLPDLTVLSFHGLYIRGFNAWLLYPLLWLTDLEILVNAIIKVVSYSQMPTNNDDLSHLLTQYQSELVMPTLWSKMAKWIYRLRKYPANSGQADNPAQATMNAYFDSADPGPALNEVYREINAFFSR